MTKKMLRVNHLKPADKRKVWDRFQQAVGEDGADDLKGFMQSLNRFNPTMTHLGVLDKEECNETE